MSMELCPHIRPTQHSLILHAVNGSRGRCATVCAEARHAEHKAAIPNLDRCHEARLPREGSGVYSRIHARPKHLNAVDNGVDVRVQVGGVGGQLDVSVCSGKVFIPGAAMVASHSIDNLSVGLFARHDAQRENEDGQVFHARKI